MLWEEKFAASYRPVKRVVAQEVLEATTADAKVSRGFVQSFGLFADERVQNSASKPVTT